MTADIVNLRQARKAKARTDKQRQAEQNRALHGRTKGQRHVEALDKDRASKALDAAKCEPGADGTPKPDHDD